MINWINRMIYSRIDEYITSGKVRQEKEHTFLKIQVQKAGCFIAKHPADEKILQYLKGCNS